MKISALLVTVGILTQYRSRIHERKILSRFLGIILRVSLRFEVSVYNVYIENQFQTTFAQGGEDNFLVEMTLNSKRKILNTFCLVLG